MTTLTTKSIHRIITLLIFVMCKHCLHRYICNGKADTPTQTVPQNPTVIDLGFNDGLPAVTYNEIMGFHERLYSQVRIPAGNVELTEEKLEELRAVIAVEVAWLKMLCNKLIRKILKSKVPFFDSYDDARAYFQEHGIEIDRGTLYLLEYVYRNEFVSESHDWNLTDALELFRSYLPRLRKPLIDIFMTVGKIEPIDLIRMDAMFNSVMFLRFSCGGSQEVRMF